MGSHEKHLARADAILGREPPPAPAFPRPRQPAPPIPTLGDLLADDGPNWVRACCGGLNCTYERALPLVQFAIRWGLAASTDRLRASILCPRCGHKGGRIIRPSCNGKGEPEVFPA